MSETERLVYAAERYLNSLEFKVAVPEAGEDVKVMGYRRYRHLSLSVALALVDRGLPTARTYFARKAEIQSSLQDTLSRSQHEVERITVAINTLDDEMRGEGGMYLTVLGTSAEGADCGLVGRGNRVNGVSALNRRLSTAAAAGKNPVSHVGKIYSLLTHHIAGQAYSEVPGLHEVYVWLRSQIGQPIEQPLIASVQLALQPGVSLAALHHRQCQRQTGRRVEGTRQVQSALRELPRAFAHYDPEDVWQALLTTMAVFGWVSRETAARLGYAYSHEGAEHAAERVREMMIGR